MHISGEIRTKRLILRPLRPEDAPAIAEGIGQWEVIKWLTTPPFPYALSDAEWFVSAPVGREALAITLAGELVGVVGLHGGKGDPPDLGYWLNRRLHGQGYMTEAASGALKAYFVQGGDRVTSSYLVGNRASCNVLSKLGFRPTEIVMAPSRPIGHPVRSQLMELLAQDFRG